MEKISPESYLCYLFNCNGEIVGWGKNYFHDNNHDDSGNGLIMIIVIVIITITVNMMMMFHQLNNPNLDDNYHDGSEFILFFFVSFSVVHEDFW